MCDVIFSGFFFGFFFGFFAFTENKNVIYIGLSLPTLLKQTIEKSIYKDCGEGKVLIRLKIQS